MTLLINFWMSQCVNEGILLQAHSFGTILLIILRWDTQFFFQILDSHGTHILARLDHHHLLVLLYFSTVMPYVNATTACRWRASIQKILLIKSILHVDDLQLKLSDQVVNFDDGFLFGFFSLHFCTDPDDHFLLFHKFGFKQFDTLFVFIEFAQVLLTHGLCFSY